MRDECETGHGAMVDKIVTEAQSTGTRMWETFKQEGTLFGVLYPDAAYRPSNEVYGCALEVS